MLSPALLCRPRSFVARAPLSPALLCRPRSFVALFSLLILLVLASAPSAQAQSGYPGGGGGGGGSYGAPTYTGGQLVLQNSGGTNTINYAPSNGQYGADYYSSAGPGETASANASGTISYTSTWDGGSNNLPTPPVVIKVETCTVEYTDAFGSGAFGTGTDSNPLAASGAQPPSPPGTAWTCTQYTVINSPPATISDRLAGASASSSATVPSGDSATISAGVYDAVSYSPVAISLQGPTPDSSGNLDILVGQYCQASLSGLPTFPTGTTVSYQWSVSGTTFQSWVASSPNNVDASFYDDGPGPLTNSTAGWYWNDFQAPTAETVSCTATVTPPAGQGSAFTVTATQQVTVYRPQFTAKGFGGGMEVSTALPAGNGTDFWLWAGALSGTMGTGGMDWYATVAPPLGTGTLFGSGTLQLVQLIIPNETYTDAMGDTLHNSDNGQEGLDIYYPYGWLISGAPNYHSTDQPGLDLTTTPAALSVTFGDQFQDYLMYYPPGSAQCVPLADFVWTTNGSASQTWTYIAPGLAGSVSPSNKLTNFVPTNGWPIWTQIDDPANEHWE